MSARKADDERRKGIINLVGDGEIEKGLQLAEVEDIGFLFAIGNFFWEEKTFDSVEKVYTRIIQLDPGDAAAWYNKGVVLGTLGNYEEALRCYDEALRIDPGDAATWSNKGVALGNLGNYEEEIHCYDEALRIDPDYAFAWSNKGVALGNLGNYEEALRCFDEALRIDPDYADAWYNKGVALGNLGKYEEELRCFDEALRIDPGNADAWYNKGVVLGNLGKYGEEIHSYDRAIRIDPSNANAWYNKGVVLGNLGKYEEALRCFDETLRIDPSNADAWSYQGVVLGTLGKYEEALHYFDEALRINPHNAGAYYNQGLAFLDLYQYKNAFHSLKKAKKLYSEKKSKRHVKEITGYQLWAQALQNWSKEEYKKALFHFKKSASIFRDLQSDTIADSLNLITRVIPLDQQFLDALHVQNIPELKEKSSRVCEKIHELINVVNGNISPLVREIILAKADCFSALCDALEFKEPDFQKLDSARKTFEKLEFDASKVGVKSLDTIIRILSGYTCLEDIPDPIKHSIIQELDNLTVLDGALTGRIPIKKGYSTPKSTTI